MMPTTKRIIFVTEQQQLDSINVHKWIVIDATTNAPFARTGDAEVLNDEDAFQSIDVDMDVPVHPEVVEFVCSLIDKQRRIKNGALSAVSGVAVVCTSDVMATDVKLLCVEWMINWGNR